MVTRNSLPELFGAALVINLADRVDRRRAIENEFRKVGWNSVLFFPAFKFDDAAGFPHVGWRGCFYSHLGCLQFAQQSGIESILVFEDDVALSSSIVRLTPLIEDALDNLRWDFLYFGHEKTGAIPRANNRTEHVDFECYKNELLTAHFYAVHKRIIPRLIAHFERNAGTVPHDGSYGPMPADGAYNTFRVFNEDVVTYIANPKLGWQRPSRSDLAPGRLDNLTMLRPLLGRVRQIKHFLNVKWNDY